MTADAAPTPPDHPAVYRIVDANVNRCLEGLRVVEEYLRFVVEDAHLAAGCKQLRHDLVASIEGLAKYRLHAARDIAHDVGATIRTSAEYRRGDVASLVAANWSRVQQALRSLEEYIKLLAPAAGAPEQAARMESLRYRAYALERATSLLQGSRERLATARLYVLLDGRPSLTEFERLLGELLEGGVDVVQLRDKTLSDRELLERARAIRSMTRSQQVLFIMNDRVDLALMAQADGVHLGQTEVTVKDARRWMGVDALIGVSTHTIEQARQAVLDGANYLGCGPTFVSATKRFECFPGLDFLRQVRSEIGLPAFAIGGIGQDNVAHVCATGMDRIAVCHSVTAAAHPADAARQLREMVVAAQATAQQPSAGGGADGPRPTDLGRRDNA